MPESIVITCGLRKILDSREIGIREFARELDISHVNLLHICADRQLPRLDLGLRIAKKLKLKVEAIWKVS